MPLSIILMLLLFAIIFTKTRPKVSYRCLILAFSMLILASLAPIADRIMAPIEDHYEAFTRSAKPVDYVIVLGCGHTTDPTLPETSQLKVCSLQRLVEALRIYRIHPEATIITSGASHSDEVSNAQKMKLAAISLGIPAEKILVETFPKDTEEEAQLIAPRVLGKNVILITNADHMPRSMNYFQQEGVYPIAAPAGKWVKDPNGKADWGYYVPSIKKFEQTTNAWYETIGRLVQWLKQLIA